jgi:hypothetical protein
VVINWTQQGAGLRNAGINQQGVQQHFGNALTSFNYANQNRAAAPNPFGPRLTQFSNPFDTSSAHVALTGLGQDVGRNQAAARQQNAQAAGLPITMLSGFMERQGQGNSTAIANNISRNGLQSVQPFMAPALDWQLRNTVRSNVQGGRGIVGIGKALAPAIIGWGAGGFALPSLAGTGGGFLKSLPANLARSYTAAPGLASKAQGFALGQIRR